MTAHRVSTDRYTALANGQVTVTDPGSGGTVNLLGLNGAIGAFSGGGARYLPKGVPVGVTFKAIVGASGATFATLSPANTWVCASGDMAEFTSVGSNTWRGVVVSATGAKTTAANVTFDDVSADLGATTVQGAIDALDTRTDV